jgi:hypothetical protein
MFLMLGVADKGHGAKLSENSANIALSGLLAAFGDSFRHSRSTRILMGKRYRLISGGYG